jgi:glucose-1-phosphate adenylyltransferase
MSTPNLETYAIVLAGGRGKRLGMLTGDQCKPAMPFGATARVIDFALSNVLHSGIRRVSVATQHRRASLAAHLTGAWQPIARSFGAALTEWTGCEDGTPRQFLGTADAVYKNWPAIVASGARYVLVLAGDHVYNMDYRTLLADHVANDADVTIGGVEVTLAEASKFGVMAVDADDRITAFYEKPAQPAPLPNDPLHALASMGIYVFDTAFLQRALFADARSSGSSHDFGYDILPRAIAYGARTYCFRFRSSADIGHGYWRDVGEPGTYWRAQMELLEPGNPIVADRRLWPLLTGAELDSGTGEHPRSLTAPDCVADDMMIVHSVICDDVHIGAYSCIHDSVVLPGARIGRNCFLDRVVVAPGCTIPDNSVVGPRAAVRHGSTKWSGEPIVVAPHSGPAYIRRRAAEPSPSLTVSEERRYG